MEDVTVRLSTDGSDAEGSCNTEGMKLLQAHSIEDLSSCSNDSNSSRSESRGLSLETKHQSIELHQELLNVIRAMDSPIVDSLAIPKTRSENARRYADKHSERMVHQPANRTPSFPLQLKDFESSISSSQDSPYSLQISTASAHVNQFYISLGNALYRVANHVTEISRDTERLTKDPSVLFLPVFLERMKKIGGEFGEMSTSFDMKCERVLKANSTLCTLLNLWHPMEPIGR